MPLTPEELGEVARKRRIQLGRTQIEVVEIAADAMGAKVFSEPTYRALETGRTAASDRTLAAVARGLDWPSEALIRARAGDWRLIDVPVDEATRRRADGEPVKVSSSDDVDWPELEGFDDLQDQARALRDEARRRRASS